MDFGSVFTDGLRAAFGSQCSGVRACCHRPQPPIRVHRPPELRPGRLSARRRVRDHDHRRRRCAALAGSAGRYRSCDRSRAVAGHPHTSAPGRLSRNRHDLGGRDPAHRRGVEPARGPHRRLVRHRRIRDESFFDLNPISEGRYGIGEVSFDHRTLWVMTVAWALVALDNRRRVVPRSQSVRPCPALRTRGRGRSAQPREERVRDQAAEPRRGWRDGGARRDRHRDRRRRIRIPTTSARRSRSSRTRCSSSAAWPACSDPSSEP